MYTLSEEQYHLEAEPILRQIFVNDRTINKPFSTNITERVILYPCDEYLETPLLDALIAGASILGDTGCYLTQTWRNKNEVGHCYIPLSELRFGFDSFDEHIEVLLGTQLGPEYVLYSSQGKWGFMLSIEHHGLLGGTSEFMECVRQLVPDLDKQVDDFLDSQADEKFAIPTANLSWLPGLLSHVYGEETAKKMLEEKGLP